MNGLMEQYSSDEDEWIPEQLQQHQQPRRPRVFRERINFCASAPSDSPRFRLVDEQIAALTELLAPAIEHPTLRNHALSPEQQLKLALRFFATGADFQVLADAHGVSQSTVQRTVHRVVDAVNSNLFSQFVDWPQDTRHAVAEYRSKGGMPAVAGCIDGTHIRIKRPVFDEEQFVNRHGTHSINAMLVCGPDLRFYYCSAKFPGSVSDQRVFRKSMLSRRIESGWRPLLGAVILADSGYANTSVIITPILIPRTLQEESFNRCHKKTRRLIECAIGVLKQRFRCLLKSMHFEPEVAANMIKGCVTLHNLLMKPCEAQELLDAYDMGQLDFDMNLEEEEVGGNVNANNFRREQLTALF